MRKDETTGSAAFRTPLWQRADALGGRVRGEVLARTGLSATDVEDLWASLLAAAVRQPGTPGALPADASDWTDAQLAAWLRTALSRDVIDEHRRRVDSTGEAWIAGTPLDDLEAELEGRTIFSSLRPPTPEDAVLQRDAVERRTEDLRLVVGIDAAQMMLAEAAGATGPEQRELMNLSVGRWRTLQGRVEFAAAELRSRAQAVLLWLWPEAWVRWVAGALGGAGGTVLSAGTAAKVAGTIALVGGVVGGAQVITEQPPREGVRPALAVSARNAGGTPPPSTLTAAGARAAGSGSVAGATLAGTQQAAEHVRAAEAARRAAARRKAAARQRAKLAAERRARERRAAAATAASVRRAPDTTTAQAPQPTSTPASGGAATGGTGSSAAATEFLPSGR